MRAVLQIIGKRYFVFLLLLRWPIYMYFVSFLLVAVASKTLTRARPNTLFVLHNVSYDHMNVWMLNTNYGHTRLGKLCMRTTCTHRGRRGSRQKKSQPTRRSSSGASYGDLQRHFFYLYLGAERSCDKFNALHTLWLCLRALRPRLL